MQLAMASDASTAVAENAVLQQKLQSKTQALLILSKELDRCRAEGDEYRELTQRLQVQDSSRRHGAFESFLGWARRGC